MDAEVHVSHMTVTDFALQLGVKCDRKRGASHCDGSFDTDDEHCGKSAGHYGPPPTKTDETRLVCPHLFAAHRLGPPPPRHS